MHNPYRILPILLLALFLIPSVAMSADITLAWDSVPGEYIEGYRIFVREEGDLYNYEFPEWEGNGTQITLTGFDAVESYYFVVRAFDVNGNESGDSEEVYWSPSGSTGQTSSSLGTTTGADAGGGGCFISNLIGD